ncbi:Gfo/Idh/MocA family oxidoreductase [Pseudomonas aeruginosa]|nr:Gfo/Idh/MocA family oxidoreductase [Pseudomonas aeruginosa]
MLGFIGAGNYARVTHADSRLKAAGAQFHTIATAGGINGVILRQKAGFAEASTDVDAMLANLTINTVAAVTGHDSPLASWFRSAGKSVFVEKPLAIHMQASCKRSETPIRQPTPMALLHSSWLGSTAVLAAGAEDEVVAAAVKEPKSFIMTMNAGAIPANHWTQDKAVGGGRIIGEACHFIDLMRFLAGSRIVSVQARSMGDGAGVEVTEDKASITLGFEDGSLALFCTWPMARPVS